MASGITLYQFRSAGAWGLFGILCFSVLAFGTVDTWAWAIVAAGVLGLASLWALRAIVRPYVFVWSSLAVPLVLIASTAALQYFGGFTAHPYATSNELTRWLVYAVFFVLAVNVLSDEWIRRRFTGALVWFGFILAAGALLQYYWSPEMAYGFREAPGARIFGPFADRNHFAVLMELLFPGACVYAYRQREKRLLYFVLCGLMLTAVVVCRSRAGFVVILAELGVVLIGLAVDSLRSRKSNRAAAVLAVFALAAVAVGMVFASGVGETLVRFEGEAFARGVGRFEIAWATWGLFLERPWLGYGLGAFPSVFAAHAPADTGVFWNAAHCDPAQLAMEAGVAGLAAQGLMAALLFFRRHGMRVWLGAVLPLAAAWCHSWTEFPLQMPSLVLVAVTLLAIVAVEPGRISVRRRGEDPPKSDRVVRSRN